MSNLRLFLIYEFQFLFFFVDFVPYSECLFDSFNKYFLFEVLDLSESFWLDNPVGPGRGAL